MSDYFLQVRIIESVIVVIDIEWKSVVNGA